LHHHDRLLRTGALPKQGKNRRSLRNAHTPFTMPYRALPHRAQKLYLFEALNLVFVVCKRESPLRAHTIVLMYGMAQQLRAHPHWSRPRRRPLSRGHGHGTTLLSPLAQSGVQYAQHEHAPRAQRGQGLVGAHLRPQAEAPGRSSRRDLADSFVSGPVCSDMRVGNRGGPDLFPTGLSPMTPCFPNPYHIRQVAEKRLVRALHERREHRQAGHP